MPETSEPLKSVDLVFPGSIANGMYGMGALDRIAKLRAAGHLRFTIGNLIGNSTIVLFLLLFLADKTYCYDEIRGILAPNRIFKFFAPFWSTLYQHLRHPSNLWPPFLRIFFRQKAIFSNQPLCNLIRQYLTDADIRRILLSPINLKIITVNDERVGDIETHTTIWDTHGKFLQDNPSVVWDVAEATTGLQVLFPNKEINGKFYSDGILFNRPISVLAQTKPDLGIVIGLNLDPACSPVTDMSRSTWLERHRTCQRALINENDRLRHEGFTLTNNDILVMRDLEEQVREVKKFISPDMQTEALEFLESKFQRAEERQHIHGLTYIPVISATNTIPMEEPSLRNFSSNDLHVLYEAGRRDIIRVFRDNALISEEVAAQELMELG